MAKYEPFYNGHYYNQRKAALQLGLATKDELAFLSDSEVTDRINNSKYVVFYDGNDYALLPEEYADKIVWINR